ncbi:hypothetical protein Halha_1504 [Halobacteroides halobius DSM 5150]|uniref:Uncharacterized protein n=1 Tax=Halobacteroides halobius (strain ATCC 35273 / DSM 5150 / MD-1) TaxID=748449 RepID=L0KA85_HALHC|nr:hypothetical protein [Halobacteroides halobius]AGB41445.1 hypothetical protein Halha_1504 [Halobacteroides halobius DSM 5150]
MFWVLIILGVIFVFLWVMKPQDKKSNLKMFDTYSHYLSKYQKLKDKKKGKQKEN